MTTTHKTWSFIGGDDWILNVKITDQNGDAYNLDNLQEIKWLLHNPSGEIWPHSSILSKLDAPKGLLSVWIPAAETTKFVGGMWTDWLRIVCDGLVRTVLTGMLNVTADPWTAKEAVVPFSISALGFGRQSVENVVVVLERERIRRRPARANTATGSAADTGTAGTGTAGRSRSGSVVLWDGRTRSSGAA